MPSMLKQKGTGDLYINTPVMAARSDMEPVEETDLSPVGEAVKPKKATRVRKPKVTKAPVDPDEIPPLEGLENAFKSE